MTFANITWRRCLPVGTTIRRWRRNYGLFSTHFLLSAMLISWDFCKIYSQKNYIVRQKLLEVQLNYCIVCFNVYCNNYCIADHDDWERREERRRRREKRNEWFQSDANLLIEGSFFLCCSYTTVYYFILASFAHLNNNNDNDLPSRFYFITTHRKRFLSYQQYCFCHELFYS